MTEEKSSTALFAVVGLLAPVVAAWVMLFALGSLDVDWVLTGVLALGVGMLVVNVIQRFVPGVFSAAFVEDESDDDLEVEAVAEAVEEDDEEDEEIVAPRPRILVASSALQGLSVGLLTAYFTGEPAVSVAVGEIFGALGMGVSMLFARKLTAVA